MTLISVLIVSSIAVSTAVTLALIGSDHAAVANLFGKITQARSMADACAEVALQDIALDPTFTTDQQSMNFPNINGRCFYTVLSISDNGIEKREIQAIGKVATSYAKADILVAVGPTETYPTPVLESWTPVAHFEE